MPKGLTFNINNDLTVIYYTSNYLEEKNLYFLKNCWAQLMKATEGLPMVVVSQKPLDPAIYGINREPAIVNLVMDGIGRSHLNIYRQILEGAKLAKTKYVAMAEDDILYSREHFIPDFALKESEKTPDTYFYDMAKVSLFTWTKPPIFSFRTKRKVVNQLIAPRQMLIDNLEERFARWPSFIAEQAQRVLPRVNPPEHYLKYWGDPGRYEDIMGITRRNTFEYYSWVPSIVFSHAFAFGYETNQGKKKKHGDLRIVELADWGKASDILKLYERK